MTEQKIPDLWWSPSLGKFLTRHENSADEHLVWIVHLTHESLRHHLGTGPNSNPPMPADAVRLVPAPPAPRVWFPGDTVPAGVRTVDHRGSITRCTFAQTSNWIQVEVTGVPSPEEWQAAVDRAHRARLDEATAQPHLDRSRAEREAGRNRNPEGTTP